MHWIRVSPAHLYGAAARFRESAHQIRQNARRMRAALEGTTWQGTSRYRFDDRFQEWEREAERVADALEAVAGELTAAAQAFEAADRSP